VANHPVPGLVEEFNWQGMAVFGIDNPNLFSYSPIKVLNVTDANQAIAELQRDDMDPRSSLVVIGSDTLPTALSAVSEAHAIAIPGGWKVHASGEGSHVLLMPLQFSHCWEMKIEAGDQNAHLIRANVAMAVLVFENEITATILYRFQAPNKLACRRADYEGDRRIGLITIP
jgi:hypothetical protein